MNATTIAGKLNQNPARVRQWIRTYPNVLKREGAGAGTKFFALQPGVVTSR